MKKYVLRFVLPVIGIALLSIGQAQARQSYQSQHQGVEHAAYRFEKSAKHMHRYLYDTLGRAYLTKSARKLIRAAKHYRRALKHHEPYRYQRRQFAELAARFRDFRSEYRHAYLPESRRTHQAIRRLNASFRDLRHETRHAGHHRAQYRSRGSYRGDHQRWPRGDFAVLEDSP